MERSDFERRLKWITRPILFFAAVLGVASYLYEGESIGNALYATLQLFFVGGDIEAANLGIAVTRWLAPLSITTAVFVEIRPLYRWLGDKIVFFTTKTVIYSDSDMGRYLFENMHRKAVLADGSHIFQKAEKTVIFMEDDARALCIYREIHKEKGKTYLCFREMEPNLLPTSGKTVVFNVNDMIAGYFWQKECPLLDTFTKERKSELNVVILGFDVLGQRILYKGLLLNLFSLTQSIYYHIYDEANSAKENAPSTLQTMNDDRVVFHAYEERYDMLKQADIIVCTQNQVRPRELQRILYENDKAQVYYYDPDGIKMETAFGEESKLELKRLHGYGSSRGLFTEERFFNSHTLDRAMNMNERYEKETDPQLKSSKEELWKRLDGFTKGSNVNASDYAKIGRKLLDKKVMSEEQLAEIEHIRWCRYHFLNYWRYGEVEDKTVRRKRRMHSCLIPYHQLAEDVKKNDRNVVKEWNNV